MEEGRLQTTRGEDNFIELRRVVRVHSGRSHEPLSLVHWLADFRDIAVLPVGASVHEVRRVGALLDLERSVVLPNIGISNLLVERREFDERLLPRRISHPIRLPDTIAKN